MMHDVKHLLHKEPKPRYSIFDRVLFISGGVVFCFAFACGLQNNNTLRELNLAGNSIGPEGATALAEALKVGGGVMSCTLIV